MKSKSVINMVGIQCRPEAEDKFNTWYSEVHIPMLLKDKGLRRVTRYKCLGTDEKYPTYLAIYEFDSREAFEAYDTGRALAAASEEARNTWGERGSRDYETKWRVQYEAIRTWQK